MGDASTNHQRSLPERPSPKSNQYEDDTAENGEPKSAASKRRSTSSATNNNNDDENGKKKRRKVNHACVYCRRSHMTCDLERPCARCVKRDIGHLCHDEPRDPPKRSKSDLGVAEIAPAPEGVTKDDMSVVNGAFGPGQTEMPANYPMAGTVNGGGPPLVQPTPVSPTHLQRSAPSASAAGSFPGPFMPANNLDWNGIQDDYQDIRHLHPNYMFSNPEITNEYNMLNDFLSNSLIDDGQLYGGDSDAAQMFLQDPLLATSTVNALSNIQNGQMQNQQPQPQQQQSQSMPAPQPPQSQDQIQNANKAIGDEISRPSSAFPTSEHSLNKFYLEAADPAGLSSAEDRLHKLLKAKYDAGMLKPFNYVKGYARLNSYMSKHLSRESQVRILKQLDRFRPKFREAMQSLTDMQLVLVEMWFERSLMEYDRVFASMAIPACCWRRTGEIFRGNREMAELIGVPWEKLRDGKLAIHEIIAEDSLVSYWEKFGAIAFDQSQKAILTSCSLKTPKWEVGDSGGREMGEGGGPQSYGSCQHPGKCEKHRGYSTNGETRGTGGQGPGGGKERRQAGETVKCCFSFTIKRDTHNM